MTVRHDARFDDPRHVSRFGEQRHDGVFGGPGLVNMVAPVFALLRINATGDRLLINSSGDFLRIS